ncbi:hypothetical protein [Ruminococcus sp. NK3A76]|uniref:hypothetical protein n=1 Tax=Ruminococcus sp. NK3A76 TaxID=877411 RepID=UPI00048FB151|nr:hypothetical protein [Ruminococcus sp. NK3A76]
MPERERAFYFNTRYTIGEEKDFLSSCSEQPYASVVSAVDAEVFLSAYAKFRRKRVLPILLFSAVGAAIMTYAFFGSTRWANENDAYMTAIYACVPLGVAAALGLKSYLKSAAFFRHIGRKYGEDWGRICEISFYEGEFTYHDRMRRWPMLAKGIEVIPYSAVCKIYTNDIFLALIDKDDRSFCMMKADLPAGAYEWITERCQRAKITKEAGLVKRSNAAF